MSERNNVLIFLAVFMAIGMAATAMQIFQGSDTNEITISLNNTGNLDTPIQSIIYESQSRGDIKSILDIHILSGYSDPRYLSNGEYFSNQRLVIIDGSKVTTESDIPLMFRGALPGVNDGADIRLTTLDGTPIAREIENHWTATDEVSLFYPFDTVASTDSQFYIWYGNTALTEPAAASTYGGQAVWDANYLEVYHLNQDPNGDLADIIKDSTSNANHGTPSGSMTSADLVDFSYGKGIDFDGANDYIVSKNVWGISGNADRTFIISSRVDGASAAMISNWLTGLNYGDSYAIDTYLSNWYLSGAGGGNEYDTGVANDLGEHIHAVVHSAGVSRWYLDNSEIGAGFTHTYTTTDSQLIMGGHGWQNVVDTHMDGVLNEVWVSDVARSANYRSTIYNNLNNPTTSGTAPFYTSVSNGPNSILQVTPSQITLNSVQNTTGTYGLYPIIPANTEQDFILNGTQNFTYAIDFTPTDLTVTSTSSILYAGKSHTFNAVVTDHNTGITMPIQPDKVKYRLVGSGNTSVSAKEFVGTSISLPALQKGTYTLHTSVGWNNIPTWSNEISQSVTLTDAATPVQTIIDSITDSVTDSTSNDTTTTPTDVLVGAPGRIVDGWGTMWDSLIRVLKNIIHNISAVFS